MKIVKNNYQYRVDNIPYPISVTCSYCESELILEQGDISVKHSTAAIPYIGYTCPCCKMNRAYLDKQKDPPQPNTDPREHIVLPDPPQDRITQIEKLPLFVRIVICLVILVLAAYFITYIIPPIA